jgi:hypothetical protein
LWLEGIVAEVIQAPKLDWSDFIALMDADEAEALRARRAAMLNDVPYSN